MIPRIIHYCWFGKKEKPLNVQRCITSWHEVLPDYEIIEWNESNFDYNLFNYTRDAYNAKKYAFVSDVARVKALSEYGGIYLDTDVMVYKPFDKILNQKCVLGLELANFVATSFMACEQGFYLMTDFYELYRNLPFYDEDGKIISGTNVGKLTEMLMHKGFKKENRYQEIGDGICIYPREFFSPYNYSWDYSEKTDNTICEHLFFVSWLPWYKRLKKKIKKYAGRFLRRLKLL